MSDKTLVIVMQTDKNNFGFAGKKIVGLTSDEWIEYRLGKRFKRVVRSQSWGDDKNCVYVCWDDTLADVHSLKQGCCKTKLCQATFAYIQKTLQSFVLDNLVAKGVVLHDRQGLYIDQTAEVQSGVEIFAPNVLCGNVVLKKDTVVYPYCFLHECVVGQNCSIGPFATIRPGSVVGNNCRVGNFVEIKNSKLESDVKVAHLSYVGDASVGQNTNVGCGVVFANYDGKTKHFTQVGKDCFLGCNANLVAPLSIDDGCFVAAGTTVTHNLDKNTFAIGRAKQTTKNRSD